MISYSVARTYSSFKVRLLVIVLGILFGLSFEAFARKQIIIEKNSAELVPLAQGVNEIFVAEKKIADVQPNGTKGLYIYGKGLGTTVVIVSNKKGEPVLDLEVQVVHNLGSLKRAIQSTYPNERITVQSTPQGVVLEGDVSSPKISKDIANLAQRHLAGKETVLNNMKITMPTQVYLSVKVAEVNRTVLNQLGINWDIQRRIGSTTFGLLGTRLPIWDVAGNGFQPSNATPALNSYGFRRVNTTGTNEVNAILDALNTEGLSSVLAEPNLVAQSGEPANVLVGGEFPVPIPQNDNITIQYKPFGISLDFLPTVLGPDLINLHVRPEVSEIDRTNVLSIPTIGGVINIPSIKTRRAETTLEMGTGQSMVIAGLFSRSMRNTINEIPGVGDIPFLGALFRSSRFQNDESELIIIVTPYLVKPTSRANLKLPNDNLKFANQLEMIFFNRLNSYGHNDNVQNFAAASTQNLAAEVNETTLGGQSLESNLAYTDTNAAQEVNKDTGAGFSSLEDQRLVGDAGFYTE